MRPLKELHGKLIKLKMAKSPFPKKVRGEAVTTWVKPTLVADLAVHHWTDSRAKCAIPFIRHLLKSRQARGRGPRERETANNQNQTRTSLRI